MNDTIRIRGELGAPYSMQDGVDERLDFEDLASGGGYGVRVGLHLQPLQRQIAEATDARGEREKGARIIGYRPRGRFV